MGGVASEEVPLPQQQICLLGPQLSEVPPTAHAVRANLGTTKQAFQLRPLLMLEGNPRLQQTGVLVPLRARAAGSVTLLSCAEVGDGVSSDGWPRVLRYQGRWHQEVSRDAHDVNDVHDVHVPCCLPRESDTTGNTWPLLLLLQPGEISDTTVTGTPDAAVDGTARPGSLVVVKQVIAWRGQAFQLQEMFGLQELHSAADDSSTRACLLGKNDGYGSKVGIPRTRNSLWRPQRMWNASDSPWSALVPANWGEIYKRIY
eukprot:s180_g50.t1